MEKSSFLVFLVVATLVTRVSAQRTTRICHQQSDCNIKEECCVSGLLQFESHCLKKRHLGELCLEDQVPFNGMYDIVCPCMDGLECRKQTSSVITDGATCHPKKEH
ncbi:uncharacterized protein [Parasteatoda tepidariorum]|uniref:uncharacterized protein n=1 Tax=Parasteatoda tepidariorum TaxID=114398 RepID=UPI00077FD4E6|nr:uncharacterized protein LOC107457215 [Parasteatoda tepidariorum]